MKNLKTNERTDGWDSGYEDNFPYHNPTGNEFPIMAYYPTVQPKDGNGNSINNLNVTDDDLNILRECGFNIALGSPARWAFPLVTNILIFLSVPKCQGQRIPHLFLSKNLKNIV